MAEQLIDNTQYLVTSCLTAVAQTPLGQVFLRILDRGFWIVEKSAQWSLPQHELQTEENGKSFQSMELVKPMPWLLFLPTLVLLRLMRFGWNVGGIVLGYPTIEPSDIVKCVQKTRRRLRTIKTNGIKTLRQKRVANIRPLEKSLQEANRSLIKSIQLTLSSLSCLDSSKSNHSPPPTRIQVSVNHEMPASPDEKFATKSMTTFGPVDQKRKYTQIISDGPDTDGSDESDEDETLHSKIERLVREGSFEDHDFEPNESSDDCNTTETDVEDDEKQIPQQEVDDLVLENSILPQVLRHRSDNNSPKIDSVRDTQDTYPTNNKIHPEIQLAEEQRDYYSPHSGDEVEATFYSPISSKSASPERVMPTFEGRRDEQSMKAREVEENCNAGVDDKITEKSNGHAEASGSEKISNANKCPSKFQNKSYKGKKMTHGSRKKK